MILAVNIGNTNIRAAVGLTSPLSDAAISGQQVEGAASFAVFIEQSFGQNIWGKLTGAVIASVVPVKIPSVVGAIAERSAFTPRLVDARDCGLDLSLYDGLPGLDRVIGCMAALALCPPPLIVVDFGTATTINAVGEKGEFLGGAILPGLQIGLDALADKTAQLPALGDLNQPAPLIGRSTAENLRSGAVRGAAFAAEGYLRAIQKELNGEMQVIVTGGHAPLILPYCEFAHSYQPDLLIQGLFLLADKH
ncbi:MAG: type III pantothenate kinase [Oscillospiraceae bacterium]|nr:type III pantothenate kinase [Oscillospiraceae bacterium]